MHGRRGGGDEVYLAKPFEVSVTVDAGHKTRVDIRVADGKHFGNLQEDIRHVVDGVNTFRCDAPLK